MKKRTLTIFAALCFLVLTTSLVSSNSEPQPPACCKTVSTNWVSYLIAGNNPDNEAGKANNSVGNIWVCYDPSTSLLWVIIDPHEDCTLVESHVHIGYDENDFPMTKSDNPKPGQFESARYIPVPGSLDHMHYFEGYNEGEVLYIAVHAVTNCCGNEETAWGNGCDYAIPGIPWEGSRWGWRFEYIVTACNMP